MTLWKRMNLMKYRVARQTDNSSHNLSIITTEFLSWYDGSIIEFDKKEDCERYCDGIGLDSSYVHEWEGGDNESI